MPEAPMPGRRLVFVTVPVALFTSSIDQTIVTTALSAIRRELHAQTFLVPEHKGGR